MMVDSVAVLLRGLSFIAMFQAVGGALFLILFGTWLPLSGVRIRRLLRIATLTAGALVLLQFSIEAARLAGEFSGVWDPQMQRLAWDSVVGTATRLRLGGLLLVLVGLLARRRTAAVLCILGIAVLAVAFTLLGHTVDQPHRMGLALLLLLHLLSMAFWFGAIWPLRQAVILEAPAAAAAVLERFSRFAVWIVPGMLLAGATLVVLLVPGFSVFGQPYGRLLLAKMAGFGALMGFAAVNKLRLTPALLQNDPAAVPRLRRSLLSEYLILAAVLCITAIMTELYSPDTV
ncbi:MAG TPA: CopD family protein [Steroidobacteraceae bacterium]